MAPGYLFRYPHHHVIIAILQSMNTHLLSQTRTLFGGGTRIVLEHDEYRCSQDIDFLCSFGVGYRQLRSEIAKDGYNVLFSNRSDLSFPRDIQADQYGIRFPIQHRQHQTLIKFEIIAEGRIELADATQLAWTSVPCLTIADSYAEKLLANADRSRDTSVQSRDLIDLSALRLHTPIPTEAIAKAEQAYPVVDELIAAIKLFQEKPDYRARCFKSLQVDNPQRIIDGIDLLASDFQLPKTKRRFDESGAF